MFVLATLKSIADVTQVAQLGRYYLPVYRPDAAHGRRGPDRVAGACVGSGGRSSRGWPPATCALVWADPTWAYDASWLVKRFQLHWPAIREAGDWVQAHPQVVPPTARIMTWFPWELRVASDRTTSSCPATTTRDGSRR